MLVFIKQKKYQCKIVERIMVPLIQATCKFPKTLFFANVIKLNYKF